MSKCVVSAVAGCVLALGLATASVADIYDSPAFADGVYVDGVYADADGLYVDLVITPAVATPDRPKTLADFFRRLGKSKSDKKKTGDIEVAALAAPDVTSIKKKPSAKSGLRTAGKPPRTGSPAKNVINYIRSEAPDYGVPAWFALRIALIESSYNPKARGPAGEYGVYQLKCDTAKLVGFKGKCSSLLDMKVNVHYGLTHLGKAVRMSKGNLKLAASKHNGGLGRKSLVPEYVARVF